MWRAPNVWGLKEERVKGTVQSVSAGTSNGRRKMRIERRGESALLFCSGCNLPFAVMERDRLTIQSRHKGNQHLNSLDIAELETILQFMRARLML